MGVKKITNKNLSLEVDPDKHQMEARSKIYRSWKYDFKSWFELFYFKITRDLGTDSLSLMRSELHSFTSHFLKKIYFGIIIHCELLSLGHNQSNNRGGAAGG